MQTINLTAPWTYRTPLKTITYPAGEHVVTNEIGAAAEVETGERKAAEPDPLDQSVPDLKAYLDGIDDLGEIVRLIQAEEAGKTRKSALEALAARKAALEPNDADARRFAVASLNRKVDGGDAS